MAAESLQSSGRALIARPTGAVLEQGFAAVSSDLDQIFAGAPAAGRPPKGLRRRSPVEGFVGASPRRRARGRFAVLAIAAAAALGVCAGLVVARINVAKPQVAPAPPAPPPAEVFDRPPTALDAQAAGRSAPPDVRAEAPAATARHLRMGRRALAGQAAAAHAARHAAKPAARASYRAVLAADSRLRAAYEQAIRAHAPRGMLLAYRNRWASLERQERRPDRLINEYAQLEQGLKRAAHGARGRQAGHVLYIPY